ncbi:polysaccharide deacetylase family protein [Pseudoxanthomonas sp. PXM02]|uniref:polysaccharide deacetylase family protein n=1 Tax=Pseudoxanthomonas sp. PXM02 TaxID=2769294 RepID=UPI0017802046|nr:polysaccharide deacetylase family protein [Pseudoxanthomonas sp. PXM02]MBD9479911.1 polysaccharide deacetylase family protein [Pseudoxanthomonas sp. PXM02]
MPSPTPIAAEPGPVVALMYHALHTGATPAGQDPHYTLAADDFDLQMQEIAASGGGSSAATLLQGTSRARIVVTFDDGHVSNHAVALPLLTRHGISADFFINPATVGTAGFLDWNQLREMNDAGMSIQSHGYDHVYLTQLDGQRLRQTLKAARDEIEQQVGAAVTLLAPPGGRMPRDLLSIAQECGYTHVLSSEPGVLAAADGASRPLPRMAMTAATGHLTFQRWIRRDHVAIGHERLRYRGLAFAKRMLGDTGYERLRAVALSALGRGA